MILRLGLPGKMRLQLDSDLPSPRCASLGKRGHPSASTEEWNVRETLAGPRNFELQESAMLCGRVDSWSSSSADDEGVWGRSSLPETDKD